MAISHYSLGEKEDLFTNRGRRKTNWNLFLLENGGSRRSKVETAVNISFQNYMFHTDKVALTLSVTAKGTHVEIWASIK